MKGVACVVMAQLNQVEEMTLGNCVREKCKPFWSEKYKKCFWELCTEMAEAVKEGNMLIDGKAVTILVPMLREAPKI
jgi:hypothetical protein